MNINELYGIAEKKKTELDELNDQILDAQYLVDQYDAMVVSLTEKSDKFQGFLAVAEENRTKALNNKNLLKEVLQMTKDLKGNSDIACNEMALADTRIKEVSTDIKKLIDELIFAAEVINKFSAMVIRKKTNNPLISDELITMIETAGKNANSAVALTLVALKSIYASQATNIESTAAASLEYLQSRKLYGTLSGTNALGEVTSDYDNSIKSLLKKAYHNAKKEYEKILLANKDTTKQLDNAIKLYDKALIKLNSLKSGFGAATAAAYAS